MSPTIASGSNRGVAGNRYLKDRLGAIISETARANLSYEVNRVLHPPHPRPPRRGSRHVVRFRSMAALAVGADPSVEGAGGSPRCQACIEYRRAFGHGLQYRAVPRSTRPSAIVSADSVPFRSQQLVQVDPLRVSASESVRTRRSRVVVRP